MSKVPSTRPSGSRVRKRVTIDDLASYLCLTKGTVSRALNDYPDIAERTRRRVRKAAETLGYQPMAHAQAIRTGRVRALGLVLEVGEHDGSRPFLAEFLAGVSQRAATEGWTLTLTTAANTADTLRQMKSLREENKADGFILPRTRITDARINFLHREDVPFVIYGRTQDPSGCAWYDVAGEDAMRDAVRALYKLGHRRIGFVRGGTGLNYSILRHDGYLAGLAECGLTPDPSLVAEAAVNRADGAAQTMTLLRTAQPPTAVVFAVDRAALGAYVAAQSLGLQIGRDLSVISYDGIPEGALMQPPLTTFSVDSRHAGSRLADLLIRRIRGEEPTELREISSAQFLDRSSHGTPALTSQQIAAKVRANHILMGGTK